MAEIRPFSGLRFSVEAGNLDSLTAPPYDVLNAEQRAEYAARNAHNIVHLTLPEEKSEDRSKFVKYARSSSLLAEWRRTGALVSESKPAFYRYIQTFKVPGSSETFTRTSVITLLKTEPYEKGVVLPHEQTFPKHKEDRLRILEATRAHLECIFGLFEDDDNAILDTLVNAPVDSTATCHSDDGTDQRLEPITDEATIAKLQELMASKRIWIADGHHRYETACSFRAALGEKDERIAEDYLMIALASMNDPGLVLLPTHRILKQSALSSDQILEAIQPDFELEQVVIESIWDRLAESPLGTFGVVIGDAGYLAKAKDFAALVNRIPSGSEALRSLDVSVLHSIILEHYLGVKGLESLAYTRDPDEAIEMAKSAAAAFLMNPPSVEDMRVIALEGEKMPQKSTYYFPKILSGLVVWPLADF